MKISDCRLEEEGCRGCAHYARAGLRGVLTPLLLAMGLVTAGVAASAQGTAPATPVPGGTTDGQKLTPFPGQSTRQGRSSREAVTRLGMSMHKRLSIDLRDTPLEAALNFLSQTSGVTIRADEGFNPDVRLTLKLDDVALGPMLDMIARQAGALIRPDPTGTAVLFSKRPSSMPGGSNWSPEWFGTPQIPQPPVRLTPHSITALDATHFIVLSTSQSMEKPLQVGEGADAVTVVLPLAVLSLYSVENGQMVQKSSTVYHLPEAEMKQLLAGMQRSGWSGWPKGFGKGN